jgi:ABC-type sugar transport system ATPase subunit
MVRMENICKRFDGKVALDQAQMELYQGEVLGLVGDNGAGKSTLLKILSGVLPRDGGDILIEGKKVFIGNPSQSRNLGIEMVYQDLSLCGTLKVWENIFLGRYLTSPFLKILFTFLDRRKMGIEAARLLTELGIDLPDVHQPVRNLSGGQQQAVAFCRCLLFRPKIILLDEPMASMAIWEREKILGLIHGLRDRGGSIVMVTHNLQDLFQVADRVLVLKEGRSIWSGDIIGLNPDDIAQLMFSGKAKMDMRQ